MDATSAAFEAWRAADRVAAAAERELHAAALAAAAGGIPPSLHERQRVRELRWVVDGLMRDMFRAPCSAELFGELETADRRQ